MNVFVWVKCMVYDKVLKGRFVYLRSINLDDAEFSYNIRADERYRDIVGQPAKTIDDQKKFIEWQMAQPDDYYFVVYNNSDERIGLIGVYDIHGDIGEVGREISYGNAAETMETQVLLEDFYREVLGLKKIYYVIYLNNKKQISIQKKLHRKPVKITKRAGVDCAYYELEVGNNSKRVRNMLDLLAEE